MKDFYDRYCLKNIWFHILTGFSIILIIASWICPPMGAIDSSVLAALGELFAFAALGTVIKAIDKGSSAKITKGDTVLEVGHQKQEEKPVNEEES